MARLSFLFQFISIRPKNAILDIFATHLVFKWLVFSRLAVYGIEPAEAVLRSFTNFSTNPSKRSG